MQNRIALTLGRLAPAMPSAALIACSGSDGGTIEPPPPPPVVTITVTPAQASLDTLQETVQLSVTVQNASV
ncbi:hypothetical protein PLCT1_00342 [Planctomycetaceae bacterium]|nr:hypothetical protein PLCT1_00342 [Planctomycetaceae bacterium]